VAIFFTIIFHLNKPSAAAVELADVVSPSLLLLGWGSSAVGNIGVMFFLYSSSICCRIRA